MDGRQPRAARQAISGVLLLDKPEGLSSNTTVQKVRRLFNAQKAGHTGTLDPFATGLLPICLGEATKFSADLLDADKTYEAIAQLGVTTTTGDTEGEVLERLPVVNIDATAVASVLQKFRGPIQQIPPMHSALKRDGIALYEYARKGIEVEHAPRDIQIHALELLALEHDQLKFRVCCSKGTYVRVLAEDIGAALGCGAHLIALRRLQVGPLLLEQGVTLEQLAQLSAAERVHLLHPVDHLLQTLPRLDLDDAYAARFRQGQRLMVTANVSGRVRVYGGDRLLGSALLEESGRLQPERLVVEAA
ncbi:MAG: tRNA pseudouridine(55) synthase TruB [Burkholderiaceae bacterium]|nr:MAG: tRNA pseudouridine(55) synthase TruB [Burkholderiaceae bacterium]